MNEVEYNIDHIDSIQIQKIIEKIKGGFAKNDFKLIKIRFTIGHIKIFVKNDVIYLFEHEIYIPLSPHSEDLI